MARQSNTIYCCNKSASNWHRILGKCCYYLDNDQTELEDGTVSATMKEFTYKDGHPETVALIDFKYPGKSLSDKYPAIQYQIYNSEHEYKVPVPFFIVLYYLDVQYPIKMYYVIPANIPARSYFDRCELSDKGTWMSIKMFSKFQHALRNKTWNGEELLKDANLSAIGLNGTKLKDLSNIVMKYDLPYLDFSWTGEQ